ncbi:hypothetical protein DICVIV_02517 [Dictyocaulus viviparus]|uniref:Uncharacterized protein n=1 Tax=Dictyocaulus viviparus TaxID=29172 RepID=A0A0D8Y5Q6_DICVI|nr:hypothetical protein DICVIV_02517 [Dictyocaulus viviparus]
MTVSIEVQPTVPGQVIRNHKVVRTSHDPTTHSYGPQYLSGSYEILKLFNTAAQSIYTAYYYLRGQSSEPRLGTATSQHTFVIETERRKPLLLPVGLTDGKNIKVIDDRTF